MSQSGSKRQSDHAKRRADRSSLLQHPASSKHCHTILRGRNQTQARLALANQGPYQRHKEELYDPTMLLFINENQRLAPRALKAVIVTPI